MPAAYFESLEVFEPWPESLNLQGVNDFGPNDPVDYALEHCPELKVKRSRWVNDNSVNLEYYTTKDAADALSALTDPQAGDHASLPAQTPRQALSYSMKPNSVLTIRECNSGDQKTRNAAVRSQFYKRNPLAREQNREREGGRHRQRDYLDYDEVDASQSKRRRHVHFDIGEIMLTFAVPASMSPCTMTMFRHQMMSTMAETTTGEEMGEPAK